MRQNIIKVCPCFLDIAVLFVIRQLTRKQLWQFEVQCLKVRSRREIFISDERTSVFKNDQTDSVDIYKVFVSCYVNCVTFQIELESVCQKNFISVRCMNITQGDFDFEEDCYEGIFIGVQHHDNLEQPESHSEGDIFKPIVEPLKKICFA